MNNLIKRFVFEGSGAELIWGMSVEQLHKEFGIEMRDKGDRTIYTWGEQTILNGLHLHLTSRYWNFDIEPEDRKFDHLEFWAIGDKHAKEYFQSISEHVIKNFGEPIEKDEEYLPDKIWKWHHNGLTLNLTFFEQHAYKLCFSIRQTE